MDTDVKISASILSADLGNLEAEIKKICASQCDFVHIDVMDGHFVPNLTFGPQIIKQLKPYSKLKFDVHMMVSNPENSYMQYIEAGADILTFHIEACSRPLDLIKAIQSNGCGAGISIKPQTNINALSEIINNIDLVLIMSVEPGFSGQKFDNTILNKISDVANMTATHKHKIISVDGGINPITSKLVTRAGANMLVSGEFLFRAQNFHQAVLDLKTSS